MFHRKLLDDDITSAQIMTVWWLLFLVSHSSVAHSYSSLPQETSALDDNDDDSGCCFLLFYDACLSSLVSLQLRCCQRQFCEYKWFGFTFAADSNNGNFSTNIK